MRRSVSIAAVVLAVFAYLGATEYQSPGLCPLCRTQGEPLIPADEIAHCECEKWWSEGKTLIRLAVGDCSYATCPTLSEPELRFIEMPLWRCPKDGLLFTEPR